MPGGINLDQRDDQFKLWIISGIIGVIIRDCYSAFAKLIGLAKFFIWDVGADLFVKGKEVHTFFGIILGFCADFVVGGMLGVAIGLLLEWRGKKYYLLKGWIVGLLAWFFLYRDCLSYYPGNCPGSAEGCPLQYQRLYRPFHFRN